MKKIHLNDLKNSDLFSIERKDLFFIKIYGQAKLVFAYNADLMVKIEQEEKLDGDNLFFKKIDNKLIPGKNIQFEVSPDEMNLYTSEKEIRIGNSYYYVERPLIDNIFSCQLDLLLLQIIKKEELDKRRIDAAERWDYERAAVYRDLTLIKEKIAELEIKI